MPTTRLIFGAGSLINLHSAARTIGRVPLQEEIFPCRLSGIQRSYGVADSIFSETLAREIHLAWIDLREKAGASVNGLCFAVTEHEFNLLRAREQSYRAQAVGGRLQWTGQRPRRTDFEAYAFFSEPPHRVRPGQEDTYVLREYIDTIRDGCLAISKEFYEEFEATTEPCPFPILNEPYLRRA